MIWLWRLKRARRWTRHEWRRVAEAWFALLGARLAIRRWQMPELLTRLQRAARPDPAPVAHEPIVRAVQRAAHLHPIPMLCLPQSVALSWMLARRGLTCELVIGARPKEGTLDAHAWVERDGMPINSPLDSAETHPVFLRERIVYSP
ncbi:MAG: lasso peptide biosynthesis B2 protein [Ardenticatenaceae bacterium]